MRLQKLMAQTNICIIDTPGIGDARGIEQDKINMQNVMHFLKDYKELHLLCILMEPNKCRLTKSFEFCFKELVVQFHRSILDNLVFCFTKGSLTRYKIEETRIPLNFLLNEINTKLKKSLNIEEGINAFIVDNISYKYLAKIKATALDYRDLEEDRECTKHYAQSSSQIQLMIEKALCIEPHMVERSLEVNLARNTILYLSGPISKLNESINRTVAEIAEVEENIRTCNMNEKQLLKELMKPIKLYKFRVEIIDSTLCKACSVLKEYTGEERKKYIEADPSYAKEDPFTIWEGNHLAPDDDGEYECETHGKDFEPVNCQKTFYKDEYTEMEIDPTVQQLLQNSRSKAEAIQIMFDNRQKQLKELKKEQDIISRAAAKFAVFIQHNSIIAYNDTTEAYLLLCIDIEEKSGKEYRHLVIGKLRELLEKYKAEKEFIESQIDNGSKAHLDSISPAEVMKTVKQLQQLKNYGLDLHKSFDRLMERRIVKQRREFSNFSAGEHSSMLRKAYNYVCSWLPVAIQPIFTYTPIHMRQAEGSLIKQRVNYFGTTNR